MVTVRVYYHMPDPKFIEIIELEEKTSVGKDSAITLQTSEDQQRIPPAIELSDVQKLHIIVYGRQPKCYMCGSDVHL